MKGMEVICLTWCVDEGVTGNPMKIVLIINKPTLTILIDTYGQITTILVRPTLQKRTKEMPLREKILMPPHITRISHCLLTHNPTQRQSQKNAIANALLAPIRNLSLNQTFHNK
jgi:hypothetical protein